jgi:hypothetical protein
LPNTGGGGVPLIAAAAAITGGMAIRAAHRRAQLASGDGIDDPVNVMLGLVDVPSPAPDETAT